MDAEDTKTLMLLLERFISRYSDLQTYKLLKGVEHTEPTKNYEDIRNYKLILSGVSFDTALDSIQDWCIDEYTSNEWRKIRKSLKKLGREGLLEFEFLYDWYSDVLIDEYNELENDILYR